MVFLVKYERVPRSLILNRMNMKCKFNVVLLMLAFAVLNSCQKTRVYKIPKTDRELAIYSPAFSREAYVVVRRQGAARENKFDLKVLKYDATRVTLIMSDVGDDNDTIYYTDDSAVLSVTNKGMFKRIRKYDNRFYVRNMKSGSYYISAGYVEVCILDNAAYVDYRIGKSLKSLEPS